MKQSHREELRSRVDEVLFYIWDPISVGPNPEARSEYRSFANKIVEMLEAGRDAHAIAKYLNDIETAMLSLSAKEKRIQKAVDLVFAHKKQSKRDVHINAGEPDAQPRRL